MTLVVSKHMGGSLYWKAAAALKAAHDACFKNETRDVLGMSYGPFSGTNVALGIIYTLEKDLEEATVIITKLQETIKELKGETQKELSL